MIPNPNDDFTPFPDFGFKAEKTRNGNGNRRNGNGDITSSAYPGSSLRSSGGGGFVNTLLTGLVMLFVVVYLFTQLIIPWMIDNPLTAIGYVLILISVLYILSRAVRYVFKGTGNWIITVIREIRGVKTTTSIPSPETKMYDTEESEINDAIAVLVKFGMKKQDASFKVRQVAMEYPGQKLNTQGLVKKTMDKVR